MYARLDVCGRLVEGGLRQIRDLLTLSMARKLGFGLVNSRTPNCREKPLRTYLGCPYRKPTQVDKEKILRRTCEPSFRNSAI